ncbi:uncharacterized protein LOC144633094 [Oculina patagonica]
MSCCKVMLCIFAVTWLFSSPKTDGARTDRRCSNLLRRLRKNPPSNTKIAINIGLSKARYLCHEGFKLVGQEVRTCRRGRWTENKEPKCMRPCGKPEDIPHSKVVGSSFNFNDQLRYRCVEGYTLNGPRLRTCGEDEKWSEAPTCEERIPCGQKVVNTRERIVGGQISQRGMWPWQIGLYRLNKNVYQFSCGGALVSRQWVLTAAHCFYDGRLFIGNANLYLIKAGDHNLSINETSQQEVVPENIFVHPRFKPTGLPFFDGDIALVKLSQKVTLTTEFVRAVCLPKKDEGELAIPKTKGTVAGWGVTRALERHERLSLSDISKVLRHATFTIQSDQLCFNKSGIPFNSTTAFCAGDGKGGKEGSDACVGDSGGAFVREGSDSKWVAVGVVSWGNGCAQKNQYGYYTRVYPFLDWIEKTMDKKAKEGQTDEPKNRCSRKAGSQQKRKGIDLNEDCGLDLVFVFDASVSVNRYYFQTSLEFAKELLGIIGASKRAGIIQVAAVTEAKLEFNLGDNNVDTIDKAIKAIDNILYVGWVSSYIRAIKIVKNKVAPNARNDSHQVMMFITDGLDLSGSLRREVRYLRDDKHFEVYAIGVGRKVNTRTLMSIASVNRYHNHVISVRKYKSLQEAVRRVVVTETRVLASCQSPGGIAHGKKLGIDYSHNKTVRYECDAEYTLEGEKRLICNNGKWNYDPPKCRAPCGNPGSPINGTMQGDNFRHNSWVTFACDQDYQRNGSERIKCSDGSWNGSVPVCIVVNCGPLNKPDHGDIIEQVALTFGKRIVFECNEKGYEMKGSRVRTCQSNGNWSGTPTTCELVQCGDPGKPANGQQKVSKGFVYGGSVTFTCDRNYTLKGISTMYCQENKQWTASVPQCLAPCVDPGQPHQGNRIGNDFRHDKTVTFTCPRDYVMVGVRTNKCTNGQWSTSKPRCMAPCDKLAPPAHGRIWGSDFSHGRSVRFYCYFGYTRVGASPVTCSDGNWDNPAPVCKGVCLPPRTPSNGRLQSYKARYLEGDEVRFSCNSGFDLFGNAQLRCVGSRKWNSREPLCKARCRFSGRPAHGYYITGSWNRGDLIRHGVKITYDCLASYTMVGANVQECDNGRWTNAVPMCKASCRPPANIAHGRKIGSDFSHGKTVRFECDARYTLDGNTRLTCNDGTWNSNPPRCKAPCSNPGAPLNGNIQGGDFRHNSWVTFVCNPNYQLDGKKQIQCKDGTWSGSVPNCIAVCPDPGVPANGQRLHDNFQDGKTVTFSCNRNYDLVGNETIRCDGGVWSSDTPECKGRCRFDGNPNNGYTPNHNFKMGESLKHGSNVEYACNVLHTMFGSNVRHCDDGSWNTSLPSCKASCRNPGMIDRGKRIGNNFSHGQMVRFECTSQGYSLVGNPRLICNDGSWDLDRPECKASCNPLPVLSDGKVHNYGINHGSLVSFSCNNGFQLKGSQQIMCMDGKWNGISPTCKGTCKDPRPLENGRIIGDDYSYDSSINFVCDSGYDLRGLASLTCQKGAWNGAIPECKKRCQDPGHPPNGWRLGVNFLHGGVVQYTCRNKTYYLVGASRITCDEGVWSPPRPSCEACARPLGLENNKNQAIRITSPASSLNSDHRPSAARLNGPFAWCPSRYSYLQIDLGQDYKLTAIATQGGTGINTWVKMYRISFMAGETIVTYSESGITKNIVGNKDASSVVQYKFKEPFVTSTVRIHPMTTGSESICLRTDLYGCDPMPDCILVGSKFWGMWSYKEDAFHYYRAYITKMNGTHVDFALKVNKDKTRSYKRTEPVLIVDRIPLMEDITVNSPVIAEHRTDRPYWYRTGTVKATSGSAFVKVKFDDGKLTKWVRLENLRLVKRPRFCEDNI